MSTDLDFDSQEPFWNRNSSAKVQKRISKLAAMIGADHKALQILLSSRWDLDSEYGMWIYTDDTPHDAVDYLLASGLVPPPFRITARALLKRLVKAHNRLCKIDVANAFVSSLQDQRPDFRSILGTYACFYGSTDESLLAALNSKNGVAGLENTTKKFDVVTYREDALRYLRSNSMEHDNAVVALLEFESFRKIKVPPPSGAAIGMLAELLNAIRKLPKSAQLQDLLKAIQFIKGNKLERKHILETLAYSDILCPRAPFLGKYHRLELCSLPRHPYKAEWNYPACWWTGKAGINEKSVSMWFEHLL
ncbi:hypothetical protein SH139x_004816 [Planctomycetaceae bacterium SH139]